MLSWIGTEEDSSIDVELHHTTSSVMQYNLVYLVTSVAVFLQFNLLALGSFDKMCL